MPVDRALSLAAVVTTRNRGARCVAAVESILSGTLRPAELIVIDQSADTRGEVACRPFESAAGFRYCRVETVGISRARNAGIGLSHCDLVAFTDDDCEASRDWLAGIADGFERDAR